MCFIHGPPRISHPRTNGSAAGHATHAAGGSPTAAFTLSELALRPEGGDAWDGGSIHGVYLVRHPARVPNC